MEQISYKIEEIDLKSKSEKYVHKVCDFYDLVFRWYEKDDPLPDRNQRIHNINNPHPHRKIFRWVVTSSEDKIIGDAYMSFEIESSPSYDSNKHTCDSDINIAPEYRRQGIGSEVLRRIVAKAKENQKSIIQTGGELQSGFDFIEHTLDGKMSMKGGENRLKIADIDWDLMNTWINEGQTKNQNTDLVFFEVCPDDIIEEYMKTYTSTMNQQPLGDMEWTYVGTPESRRLDEERRAKMKVNWYTLASKEPDGRISGLTEFFYNTTQPYRISQNLTGVNVSDRGRGLGKWLKAELITKVVKMHPDIAYISTGNADSNAPMLSINMRMGFKKNKIWQAYKFEIQALEEQLKMA